MTLRRKFLKWLVGILVLQAVLGGMLSFAIPLWRDHEPDFFDVTRFVVEQGRLPTFEDYPNGDADIRQATQPPLFFLLGAPLVALFDDGEAVPPGQNSPLICFGGNSLNQPYYNYPITDNYQFPPSGSALAGYALRLMNLGFGLVSVLFTYLAGRILFPDRKIIALMAAAFMAFEPNLLILFTYIGNDPLLIAITAVNLWLCAKLVTASQLRWRVILFILITAGLALITRLAGWAVFAFDGIVIGAVIFRVIWQARKNTQAGQLRIAFIALALLLIAGGAVGFFNYSQFGSIFGRYEELDHLIGRVLGSFNISPVTILATLDHTRFEFLATLSLLNPRNIIFIGYQVLLLLGFLSILVGAIIALYRKQGVRYSLPLLSLLVAVGLVIFRNAILSNAENTTLYNTTPIFAPIRYYSPGLPALMILLSAGFYFLLDALPVKGILRRTVETNPLAWITALVWLVVAVGFVVMLVQKKPVQTFYPAAEQAQLQSQYQLQPVSYTGDITQPAVIASRVEAETDGIIPVHVMMATAENAGINNGIIQLEMMSSTGELLQMCQVWPHQNVLPTSQWQADSITIDQIEFPNCTPDLTAPVSLQMRWLGATPDGQKIDLDGDALVLGEIQAPTMTYSQCPQTAGIISTYRVSHYTAPAQAVRGELFIPSVNWFVDALDPQAVHRMFVFQHRETGTEYICMGGDRHPALWFAGETVFFDRCPYTFPPESPLGGYDVSMMLTDAEENPLPAYSSNHTPFEGNRVPIGEVEVVSGT